MSVISYRSLCMVSAVLQTSLFVVLLFFPPVVFNLFGVDVNESAVFISRRAAFLFAGLAIIIWACRNEVRGSAVRDGVSVGIIILMLGLAMLGGLEFVRGTAQQGILVAVVIELVIGIGFLSVFCIGGDDDHGSQSVVEELPSPLPHTALKNADWGDAYRVKVRHPYASARLAGEAVIRAFPRWTYPLMVLRNILVKPFGVTGTPTGMDMPYEPVGFFPVQCETEQMIIAGFDDTHLDFRLIIDLSGTGVNQFLTLTTVVHRNNVFGRWYLAVVLPFHRAIVRSAMRKFGSL